MIVLIDGYNVLKQIMPAHLVTERERATFITMLKTYHKRSGNKVLVVFDGGPHPWPAIEEERAITIVYSGTGESADDYIIRYAEEHRNAELLLVSSDRQLMNQLQQFDVPAVSAQFFYQRLSAVIKKQLAAPAAPSTGIIKTSGRENPELDELMYQALKKQIPLKSTDYQASREVTVKVPKKERKRKKLIDKL